MKPTFKKFGEMTLWEIADVLILGMMPDGTKIKPETVKDSLYRVVPMMMECAHKDREVLNKFPLKDDQIKREWEKKVIKQESLIAKAKKILEEKT